MTFFKLLTHFTLPAFLQIMYIQFLESLTHEKLFRDYPFHLNQDVMYLVDSTPLIVVTRYSVLSHLR